jgi:hypothetical protein
MSWYRKEIFLACHDCGVMQPIAQHPADPHDDAEESAVESYSEFVAAHRMHRTGPVRRLGVDTAMDRPAWDPLATLHFEVTDGERRYVATVQRDTLDAPRTYRFGPGRIGVCHTRVGVADDDVRRGLDREFPAALLPRMKVDRFIGVLHDIIARLEPSELEIAFDDADDPSVSIARMPDGVYAQLVAESVSIFDEAEWPRVAQFLDHNRGEDGLLALRVRRRLAPLNG